jgi:hypothetical protein
MQNYAKIFESMAKSNADIEDAQSLRDGEDSQSENNDNMDGHADENEGDDESHYTM